MLMNTHMEINKHRMKSPMIKNQESQERILSADSIDLRV
jgi:hypothetical protein